MSPAGARWRLRARDGPDGGVVRGQVQVGLHRHVLTDLNPRAAALLDHLLRERRHLGREQSARSTAAVISGGANTRSGGAVRGGSENGGQRGWTLAQ